MQPDTTKPALPEPDKLDPNEQDAVTLWAEIWRLRTALQGPDGYATWQDAATAERMRRVKAEAAVAEARAEQPCEPDMRHPKIQALIGSNARRSIELNLVEQLLDNPDCDLTALDMEYWNGLHDKLRARLTAAHPAPVEQVALSDKQIDTIEAGDYIESVLSAEDLRTFARAVIAEYERINGDAAT